MASQVRGGFHTRHWLLLAFLASAACRAATPPGAAEAELPSLSPRRNLKDRRPRSASFFNCSKTAGSTCVSADPRRGEVTPDPSVEDNRPALAGGDAKLVEYRARNAAGQVVATGRFIVPMIAVSEFQDPMPRLDSGMPRSG